MQKLLRRLQEQFPELQFTSGKQFYWSPETAEVFYKAGVNGKQAEWSLLHETGHALLGHTTYKADLELLRLEVAAWEKAQALAMDLGVRIDEEHIQDCLDTYRDWLYKRSVCPACTTKSLQQGDFVHYRCHNCNTKWRVSSNRFCRTYRSKSSLTPSSSLII